MYPNFIEHIKSYQFWMKLRWTHVISLCDIAWCNKTYWSAKSLVLSLNGPVYIRRIAEPGNGKIKCWNDHRALEYDWLIGSLAAKISELLGPSELLETCKTNTSPIAVFKKWYISISYRFVNKGLCFVITEGNLNIVLMVCNERVYSQGPLFQIS